MFRVEPLEDRLAPAAGQLDPGFGDAGFVVSPAGLPLVSAIVVMPDGRVVAAGPAYDRVSKLPDPQPEAEFAVVRLAADGTPDPTFGTNGVALVDMVPGTTDDVSVNAISLRPDGGVVMAGQVDGGVALAVLTPAGQLDPAFKTDGKVIFAWPNGNGGTAAAVRALPDGSIVVAGTRVIGSVSVTRPFSETAAAAAARFRADGSFDPGYGRGGFADGPTGVAVPDAGVMPDGGAVFLYARTSPPATEAGGSYTFAVARLNPAGTPDTGYGSAGSADAFSSDFFSSVGGRSTNYTARLAAFSDGRLFTWVNSFSSTRVGPSNSVAATARLLANGTPDPIQPLAGLDFVGRLTSGTYNGVDALPDGRMLVGYTNYDSTRDGVIRTTPAGGIDPGFESPQNFSTFPRILFRGAVAATSDGGAVTTAHYATKSNLDLTPGIARLLGDAPIPAITGLRGVTAVGPGPGGGPNVGFRTSSGADAGGLQPFGADSAAGLRVAMADFNADGTADLVAGPGPGGPSRVRVLDGRTRRVLFDLAPFEASFTGGVYVAAGDTTGDGVPDLVVTPDEGGGPRVRVFDGAGVAAGAEAVVADFFGIDDPDFRGGARAAVGDVDGDGAGDLIVAAGFQGGPRVAGYSGRTLGGTRANVFPDFFAFEPTLRNGVYVAAGDVDGDAKAEVIAGGGPGGGPRVTAFSGAGLLGGQFAPVANFFGGDPESRGGIRVAVKDLDGDAKADVVVGAGDGAGSRVTGYYGKDVGPSGTPPAAFGFDALANGFTGGVFVG